MLVPVAGILQQHLLQQRQLGLHATRSMLTANYHKLAHATCLQLFTINCHMPHEEGLQPITINYHMQHANSQLP